MHSHPVHSNQEGPHSKLEATVRKHLEHPWRRPLPAWVESLADQCLKQTDDAPRILDSGCGTGLSSQLLARQYPDHWVIAVDQSAHRLGKTQHHPDIDNLMFVRADLQDWWPALVQRQTRLARHSLLYPNPWPKAQHLQRRWHAHPVWPQMLALGGQLSLRTNWAVYAQEFSLALQWSVGYPAMAEALDTAFVLKHPMTLFEKKYAESGHAIWQVLVDLRDGPKGANEQH